MRMKTFAVVAVAAAIGSGCASQMALFKGSSKKSVSVSGGVDSAFAAAAEAGKELGYKVREKKAKNMVYAQRGLGYGEYSTVIVRFSEAGAATNADFDANSSKGSDVVLQEYLDAFRKRVKIL